MENMSSNISITFKKNNMWSNCTTAAYLVEYPWTTIFAVYFYVLTFLTSISNAFVLIILSRLKSRKKSNYYKYLISLALSDLSVGLILLPLIALTFTSKTLQNSCLLDILRRYFTVFLIGATVLMIGIISFDRYLLVTKPGQHNAHISQRRSNAMIVICWVLPALVPLVRFLDEKTYLIFVGFVVLSIFILLTLCYHYLTKAVRLSERNIKEMMLNGLSRKTNDNNLNKGKTPVKEEQAQQRKDIERSTASSSTSVTQKQNNDKKVSQQTKYLRSIQTVLLLITAYILFVIPIAAYGIIAVSLKRFFTEKEFHFMYAFTYVLTVVNSVVNPFIYFIKIKDFRRELKEMFKRTSFSVIPKKTYSSTQSSTV